MMEHLQVKRNDEFRTLNMRSKFDRDARSVLEQFQSRWTSNVEEYRTAEFRIVNDTQLEKEYAIARRVARQSGTRAK